MTKKTKITFDAAGFIEEGGGTVAVSTATGYKLSRVQKWAQRGGMPLVPALEIARMRHINIFRHLGVSK